MKNDLEQFKALMNDPIKQLEDLIASLKLERDKLEAKPKPSVPTTIEAVYDEVKPKLGIMTQVVSRANVEQVHAFVQLLTLVDCLDSHFGEGDGKDMLYVNRNYDIKCGRSYWSSKPLITFKTREAAQHALKHFKPLFERYYGVSE